MATGRPDYHLPTVPGHAILVPGQAFVYKYGSVSLTADTSTTILSYTVPTGKRLFVGSLVISSDNPVVHRAGVTIGLFDQLFYVFWCINHQFVVSPFVGIVLEEGQTLYLTVWNKDNVGATFYATMVGMLEDV